MESYSIKEAVQIIRSGNWLHIRYVTADILKGTGGTVKELPRCRITRASIADINKIESEAKNTTMPKLQNHHSNFTVNVELPNKMIRKLHIVLITHINSIPVI